MRRWPYVVGSVATVLVTLSVVMPAAGAPSPGDRALQLAKRALGVATKADSRSRKADARSRQALSAARNPVVASGNIVPNGVTAADLADGAVETAKLAANAVTADKIADNAVGASEVNPDSLTAADLASDSVGSAEIINGSISGVDLEPNIGFSTTGAIGLGAVTIGGGQQITRHLSGTATNLTSASIAADACGNYGTITVTGAAVGDTVYASPDAASSATGIEDSNLSWSAVVTAANTVTIRACNPTGSAIDAGDDQEWRADVLKH